MDTIQHLKQRFGIIGNHTGLNHALEKALRVAATEISVLVIGESGVGKENIPRIIHQYSGRKHAKYIAVNCGAIPEGTIDSELFGHEKGAFTGATSTRSGYFEEADGGTIFLDEVGELPLPTQVRLLRVLENGEFFKVGSSKVQKTNVRIVAATNVKMTEAIQKNKFREDLYYRLSTVEIHIPPLRERKEDIHLLFRKFAADFAEKYRMPPLRLDENAQLLLSQHRWSGNIRQLRNVAEQMSVLEQARIINSNKLRGYLPNTTSQLPALVDAEQSKSDFASEREILYKVLFDMKSDLNDLKKLTLDLLETEEQPQFKERNQSLINKIYGDKDASEIPERLETLPVTHPSTTDVEITKPQTEDKYQFVETVEEEEPLSLQEKEIEMIRRALERSKGRRKKAAQELGISERTLYRKIKQFDLNEEDE
ncbi:MAG: sigma-54-dependent Fis family transcriptional regulator [Flavobacteriales bacterium]|nr:sigma-54-dependent Fis family transcriptional regulator [Flavobacteriales bacterium]